MDFWVRAFFYGLTLIPLFLILGITTESGTQLGAGLIRDYFIKDLDYQTLKGRFIDKIVLETIRFETATYTFSAQQAELNIDLLSLLKGPLYLPAFSIKEVLITSKTLSSDPIKIAMFSLASIPTPKKIPSAFHWHLQTDFKESSLTLQGMLDFVSQKDRSWQATLRLKTRIPLEKQGISLDDLYLSLSPQTPSLLAFVGGGRIGKAPFSLEGSTDMHKAFESTFKLKSSLIPLYQTAQTSIKAIADLNMHYIDKILSVQGTLRIPEALILLDNNELALQRSRDVMILHTKAQTPSLFKIIPRIKLILGDKLRIKSSKLEANLSGHLTISERSDGLLAAFGRLSIQQGTYRLQGRRQFIRQGSLLFPFGTLLNNPLLDIQLYTKRFSQTDAEDGGIYIQGSLQKPLIQIYAKDEYRQSALLSGLGLGDPEKENSDNQQKTMAQTALLLSGQNNPFTHILESGFGIDEFKLESRSLQNSLNNHATTDTAVVLGRPLSPKLYLQYVQTIMEPLSTVRLKYALTPKFSTSLESSTEGFGGDLTFSIEKD
ncbi:MAG: translocation/assembly module TamB domain-containing protein [Gammaproteobacteria bacterium]|nr:translocation/assembly module TamB domain-containing protein [Gammaproteobacteria bacterium]